MVPLIACVILLITFLAMIAYSEHNKKQAGHPQKP
jgi:hypothetical protein